MLAPRLDKEEILSQVKIAAMAYGLKSMASDLGKPYSTLSNELDHRDYAKLGLLTTLQIIEHSQSRHAPPQSRTAGMMVLDIIEEGLNRVAFQIPKSSNKHAHDLQFVQGVFRDYLGIGFGSRGRQMGQA